MNRFVKMAFFSAFLGFAAAPAIAAEVGNAKNGMSIAREVCARCHLVEKADQSDPLLGIPSFQEVAYSSSTTELSLRVFLRSPHKNMPNLILTDDELADVIAYIMSLR